MASEVLTQRVFNFSPGPAVLPLPVLEHAQRELLSLPGVGSSVLEISHRSKAFAGVLSSTKETLRQLLSIPDEYHIIFLQGGSRLQFSMVPMNLLRGTGLPADYIISGSWGKKARQEAQREGEVHVAWDGADTNYDRLPSDDDLQLSAKAAYVHITSNETIQGVQFSTEPSTGSAPLVCDASSDFLSSPLDITRYGLIYACAQKNAGPAGVTIVIIRDDLVARSQASLPGYLNYAEHVNNDSLYNTPPTFGIYLVGLVGCWLLDEVGGLAEMQSVNREKARLLYEVIDSSNGFFKGHAQQEARSLMNVTFNLPDEATTKAFLDGAEDCGLCDLKGHRSVGGIRASIYNAMPIEGVERLRHYMKDFATRHAS